VRHRPGLATRTQISVCKSPFPSAGTAVSLVVIMTVDNTYKSIYKIKKEDVNVHENTKRSRTMLKLLMESTFYNIINTVEHITFYITGRTLINH